MDIFATACDVAGLPVPSEIDGVSFLSTLQGKTEPELNRDLYFCWLEGGPQHGGKTTDAFRRGDWKLVQDDPFGPRELFNLRTDPGETTDLSKQEHAKWLELSAAMQRQIQRAGSVPWQPPAAVRK